jgi:hypothetical protein
MMRAGTTRSYALAGALHGAVVWGAYAVVEQALDLVAPTLKGGTGALAPSHWGVIVIVMASLLLVGLASGAASGVLLKILEDQGALVRRPVSAARIRRVALLPLVVASSVSLLLIRPFGKAEALFLAVDVALVVSLVLCEIQSGWVDRFGFCCRS